MFKLNFRDVFVAIEIRISEKLLQPNSAQAEYARSDICIIYVTLSSNSN